MYYDLSTKHLTLTEQDQQLLDDKLRRFKKHLRPPFTLHVVLAQDTHHRTGNVVNCRLTATSAGHSFHSERTAETVQTAVDEALQALRGEIVKERDKHRRRRLSWRSLFGGR